jgi:MFS superfamily sulfate permease-like transporter
MDAPPLRYAVLVGVLLSFMIFIYKYARQSNVRNVLTGAQCSSRVIRAPHVQTKLRHLGQLLVVLELCRYLFFASVISVQGMVKELLLERETKKSSRKERFLLIDFLDVDGIDVTGTMAFLEIAKSCKKAGLQVHCPPLVLFASADALNITSVLISADTVGGDDRVGRQGAAQVRPAATVHGFRKSLSQHLTTRSGFNCLPFQGSGLSRS